MKIRSIVIIICCSATLFAEQDVSAVHIEKLKRMIRPKISGHGTFTTGPVVDYLGNYMLSNHISKEFVAEVIIDMIRTSLVARTSGKDLIKDFPRWTVINEDYTLFYLSNYKTTNAMQFLQSMCLVTNGFDRYFSTRSALQGYIRCAKLDALPTLKKCIQNGRMSESDVYTSYRDFAYEIGQAEAGKQDSAKIEEAKLFLLERAQEEKRRSAANELDKILCSMFPDYKTSVQREKVSAHFMNDDNEICKKQFTKIHEDIQKTPKGKRKDFSAKGELLDPERGKNRSDVQP